MRKHPNIILSIVGLSLLLSSNLSVANEKEELALVLKQLKQVKQSLLKSEIVSGTEQSERYHFNYKAIQNDIDHVMHGIESYISPTRSQPRTLNFPVIEGEYQNE
ncbi:RAQPRD family integrative conjugative element protein [Gilliamella sp. BG3]|uniref:integrative conjugative element protein, RAQPRD family n=1 Tax=unclassified Gilliamella TaxID=2685620 RepID=UPI00398680D4